MILDLNEASKEGEFLTPCQPHVIFGRSEELDPFFKFLHDPDDLIDYPFALVRFIDWGGEREEFSVTLLSESEIASLAQWATVSAHEQFEINRGHCG